MSCHLCQHLPVGQPSPARTVPKCAAVRVAAFVLALWFFCPATPWAAPFHVAVDTPALTGVAGQLAFDLIDGGEPSNAVVISQFASDGTLGAIQTSGNVSGQLTGDLVMSDTQFFNEYLQQFIFGSGLTFTIDGTGRPASGAGFPDGLAMFLLDPLSGQSLISTSDPTGGNALFLLSFGASPQFEIYQAAGVDVSIQPVAVPEPGTLLLLVAGFAVAFALRRRCHGQRAAASGTATSRSTVPRSHAAHWAALALGALWYAGAAAADVTSVTNIERSALVFNRGSNTFDSVVTLTNVGQQSYAAPLRLFVQISPSNVSLSNGTGVGADGRAYIEIPLPGGHLNQGQAVRTTVKINNVPQVPFKVVFTVDAALDQAPGLPPDPGPAGDIPLLGIDTDRDGVRDDVQRYIALTYPAEPNTMRALRELSRTYQAMLALPSGSANEAKAVNSKAWRNRSCLVYLHGAVEGHRRAQALFAEQFNTLARYRAWSRQDDLLAGEVFESPPNAASNCDFALAR